MKSYQESIVFICLMTACLVASSKEKFMLEISNLLRSASRDNFASDKVYFEAHHKLLSKIKEDPVLSQAHPFVINLFADCTRCHDSLMHSSSISERYRVISNEKAIFYGSVNEIENLMDEYPHSIKHYIPLLPDTKIDAGLRTLTTTPVSAGGCNTVPPSLESRNPEGRVAAPNIRLTVVVAPLTVHDLNIFIKDINSMQSDKDLSFVFDFKELLPEKERSTHVEVSDCRNVEGVAVLLSKRREVLWIEQKHEIHVNNKWAKGICQSGGYSDIPVYASNLTGANQIVGVADTGLDLQSCYFLDPNVPVPYNTVDLRHRKVVTYIAYQDMVDDSVNGHGTHVCGSLLGKCYKDEYKAFNGVAYNSKIAFYDIGLAGSYTLSPPSNLESGLFGPMYSAGARIFSNSWGAPSDNTYNYLSVSVDRFMWNNPDALVIFAAGNDGPYSGSIDAPSTNKNGIAVGASLNDYNSWILYGGSDSNSETNEGGSTVFSGNSMAFFSSQGPTSDGRLKPDVMAPGWWITSAASSSPPTTSSGVSMYNSSASSHCTIKGMRGTSMSTPIVAGSAALIREYFTKGFYPSGIANSKDAFIPSGALLKAMLIHSARPLAYTVTSDSSGHQSATPISSESYPSNTQGFGRVQLNNVLSFSDSKAAPLYLFVVGAADSSSSHYTTLRNGETEKHIFYTTADITQPSIRITLAYTDYPGASGSTRPLVNDLNIVVVDSTGAVMHRSQTYQQGQSDVNNVEVILIDDPIPSTTYTVVVSSSSSLAYAQPYALVMTGQITPVRQKTVRSFIASLKNYFDNPSYNLGITLAVVIAVFLFTLFICIRFNRREKMRIKRNARARRSLNNTSG